MTQNNVKNITSDTFFELLKQLYIKQNRGSQDCFPEVLEVLRWIKPVVDFLNADIQEQQWSQSIERKLNTIQIKGLMEALNHVTFTAMSRFEGSMDIRQHVEIVHFIEFISTARREINAEHANTIINIFFGTPEQTIEKYWHYLKRYPIHTLEKDEAKLRKAEQSAQQLEQFKQDIQADINTLVSKAGMLYVLGLRIQLVHQLKSGEEFCSFFSSFEDFLDICGVLDTRVLRVVSKPIIGVDDTLEYFAILLIQDTDHSFSEASLIQNLTQELLRVYRRYSPNLEVYITNFNAVLRSHEVLANQGDFFLSDFSQHNNQLVWEWIFDFLFYWESYQKIRPDFFNHIHQEYLLSSRKKYDLKYLKLNEPEEIYYPYLLKKLPRVELVWSTTHLSSYSANYLEHLAVIYQEVLSSHRIPDFINMVVHIENFMLTLKEAPHIAFESAPSLRQQLIEFQPKHIEELATRPLLQFIQLLTHQQSISQLTRKLASHSRSKLLNHFLMVYQQKLNIVEQKAELEAILGLDISHTKGRKKLERLIADFLYHDELFEKKAIKAKPPLDISSLEDNVQSSVTIKLIDIPRHKNRLEAVRHYLKSAMKSDVIVVHYQFSCVGVEQNKELEVEKHDLAQEKEHALPQQALSKALYTMLHAGKRRMPLSQITAYLGYWEGMSTVDGDHTDFAANIYFVFKSYALQEYEDLQNELSQAWQSACYKFFSSLSPEQKQHYNINRSDLIYKTSCLIEITTEFGNKRTLKVADLVDDSDAAKRSKVLTALKNPTQRFNRDHVDIIIALGMAKEGFDWIWCEHALTIGYRSSLTEIVQIIGRATRDAEGKYRAKFTNLIAEPDASEKLVVEAVNDMLKAIAASLLMEQVLAPRFEFTPKDQGALDGFDYGEDGYQKGKNNIGINDKTGQVHVEINGLKKPESEEANRICKEDLNEIITAFVQNKSAIERGLFDQENIVPEELTQLALGKIVQEKYPELEAEDQEAVRQHAIAAFNLIQQAKKELEQAQETLGGTTPQFTDPDNKPESNLAFIQGVKRFINVRDLDIDLIDHINPFESAYAVLSKAMDEATLRQVQAHISAKRINLSPEEAKDLAIRAVQFKKERGRLPDINSQDAWEKRMAEGVAAFARFKAQEKAKSGI